jgi:hypothetical protein
VDVLPYNNRNDGGPAAGLLSLVEVPEKAIVPFMVNAFDYVAFNDRLYITFLPIKFYSYPIIVYSMSNFSEFISRKDRLVKLKISNYGNL